MSHSKRSSEKSKEWNKIENDVIILILSFYSFPFSKKMDTKFPFHGKRNGVIDVFFTNVEYLSWVHQLISLKPILQIPKIQHLYLPFVKNLNLIFEWATKNKPKMSIRIFCEQGIIDSIPPVVQWSFNVGQEASVNQIVKNSYFYLVRSLSDEIELDQVLKRDEHLISQNYSQTEIQLQYHHCHLPLNENWKYWIYTSKEKIRYLELNCLPPKNQKWDFEILNFLCKHTLPHVRFVHLNYFSPLFWSHFDMVEHQKYLKTKLISITTGIPTEEEIRCLNQFTHVEQLIIEMEHNRLSTWSFTLNKWIENWTHLKQIKIKHCSADFLTDVLIHLKTPYPLKLLFVWKQGAPYVHPEQWSLATKICKHHYSFQILQNPHSIVSKNQTKK